MVFESYLASSSKDHVSLNVLLEVLEYSVLGTTDFLQIYIDCQPPNGVLGIVIDSSLISWCNGP